MTGGNGNLHDMLSVLKDCFDLRVFASLIMGVIT